MSKWIDIFLGELGHTSTGKTPTAAYPGDFGDTYPFVTPSDSLDSKYVPYTARHLSEEGFQRLKGKALPPNSIMVSCIGSAMGKVAMNRTTSFTNQQLNSLTPSNSHHPDFIYYALKNSYKTLRNAASGSTALPILNKTEFDLLRLKVPKLKTVQQSIANVLSALDEKIEINNRINVELESLAKLLYDYWFVQFDFPMTAEQAAAHGDPTLTGKPYKSSGGKMTHNKTLNREIPEGWVGGSILDVATLGGGGTPNKKEPSFWDNGHVPFFTPTDTTNEIFCLKTASLITQEGADKSATTIYPPGTIFITARGSVGRVVITDSEIAMSQSCYALKPNAEIPSPFLLFHVHAIMGYLKAKSSGSVFKSIVTNDLKFTPSVVPCPAIIGEFAKLTNSMFDQILNNQKQNQELAALRDWLLPMLMNGQVTVQS
ncbi:restriction endonuclease subunit S [Akkermansiaceae bacterium]|nr:restriction endonuclease subunit S [Akkermansiaceae bacterium]